MRFLALLAVVAVAVIFWLLRQGGVERARRETAPGMGSPSPEERPPHHEVVPPAAPDTDRPTETTDPAAAARVWRFRVVNDADEPLADAVAEVFRFGDEATLRRATADGAGAIEIDVRKGESVVVFAPGYRRECIDSAPRLGLVRLTAGLRVSGVVLDANRRPVPGARVVLDEPFSPDRVCSADSEGRFAFDGVDARGELCGLTADHAQCRTQACVMLGDDAVELILDRGRTVRGIAVFPDGSPAAGAKVGPAISDADGRFALTGVTGLVFEVYSYWGTAAALPGEKEPPPLYRCHRVLDLTSETEDVRLVLEPFPRSFVPLRVLDARGKPVEGVRFQGGRIVALADGVWVVPLNVPPESAVEVFVGAGPRPLYVPVPAVTAAAPDAPPTEVRLPNPLLVTVVVRGPDGEALPPGTRVKFVTLGFWDALVPGTESHDRATFEFHPEPDPRIYSYGPRLIVEVPGLPTYRAPFPREAAGRTVEIRMPRGGSVRGRARDAFGRPLAEGAIRVGDTGTEEFGPQGEFEFAGLPPGKTRILLGASERRWEIERTVDVRAGEVTDVGDLVIGGPVWLTGVVTDASGRVIPNAIVRQLRDEIVVPTRPDGTFRMRLWKGFRGWLAVHKPGRAIVHRLVPDPSQPQRIELPREGRVFLRYHGGPGYGAVGYGIRVPGFDEVWQPPDSDEPRTSLDHREVRWRGVPPGRITVVAKSARGRAEKEVEVVAGATTEVEIEVP